MHILHSWKLIPVPGDSDSWGHSEPATNCEQRSFLPSLESQLWPSGGPLVDGASMREVAWWVLALTTVLCYIFEQPLCRRSATVGG